MTARARPSHAARASPYPRIICRTRTCLRLSRTQVDGRALRLPVIVVRPGAHNAALTGAWSTVVREPLNGKDCRVPVPLDVRMPVASYQVVVRAMDHLLNAVEPSVLGADRTLMLPSLSC